MVGVCSSVDERFECVCGGGVAIFGREGSSSASCGTKPSLQAAAPSAMMGIHHAVAVTGGDRPAGQWPYIERALLLKCIQLITKKFSGGENGLTNLGT